MRIEDLIKYGFSKKIIDSWRNDGLKYLLPIQIEAIKSHGLLQGNSLIISGPTSAGKTFCGELAAVKAILQNKKALLLVPLKALASEKYRELSKRYRRAGLKIIALTSDYPENRRAFEKGEYDLAVAVYEMFNALTASSLALLETVGVAAFDEFQLITTSDRGIAYETAVSRIRNFPIQLIALIGGLDDCELFSKWLDLPLLKSTTRPVELRRGVLFNGRFNFKRFNDCREGEEYFNISSEQKELDTAELQESAELISGVRHLLDKGEQVLVFVATRLASQKLAAAIATCFNLPAAESVLADLDELPDTLAKLALIDCLKKGAGFHNADLSLPFRKILEGGFRSGELRVLVSTTTLALGVNLPSKNVFLEEVKYYDGFGGESVLKPLLMYDYNQLAGRAGRFGQTDDFGRAIMIARDDIGRERIWEAFIDATARPQLPAFGIETAGEFLLRGICCGLAKDYDDSKKMLTGTLRGYSERIDKIAPLAVIDFLSEHGFVEIKGCRLVCTDLGRAVARHNIDLDMATRIRDIFDTHLLKDQFVGWLFALVNMPGCRKFILPRAGFEGRQPDLLTMLNTLLTTFDEAAEGPLADFLYNPTANISHGQIRTIGLMAEYVIETPTIELEAKYNIGSGRIKHLGERFANLFRAIAAIGDGKYLNPDQKAALSGFADRLYFGLPESGLKMAAMQIPLLERDYIFRLIEAGLDQPADIVAAGKSLLASLIPDRIAGQLYDKCLLKLESAAATQIPSISAKRFCRVERVGSRYRVHLNKVAVDLQGRLYQYFNKLYNAPGADGWLDKNLLDSGSNQVKYIYKLRKALKGVPGLTIEGDRMGRYRLILSASDRVDSAGEIADKKGAAANRR